MQIDNINELRAVLEQCKVEIPSLLINARQACTVLGVSAKTLKTWTDQRLLINYGYVSPQYELREICEFKAQNMKYVRFKELQGVSK
ncbi:MAG: hypothetical protein Q8N05_16640 [Bacteroidota bacterium]|nr:hypothetical protein [Bacteroidota bacterium]